jgi:hypothetical protein
MPDPLGLTPRYLAALSDTNQTRVVRVDVYHGTTFLQSLPNVLSGSVTRDSTASTRATLTLQLVSRGRSLDSYIPKDPTDLLHPLSGNELHVFRGFQYSDGSSDMCSLGVFRMSQPKVTDTGDQITIDIKGSDRAAEISRLKWTAPYQIVSGTDLAQAVESLLSNRWLPAEVLNFSVTPTNPIPPGYINSGQSVVVPTTTFGAALSSSNDPWADAQTLAAAGGMELFFGTQGQVVMQPLATTDQLGNPTFTKTVFPLSYEEGQNCTVVEMDNTLDETQTYSGVIAIGTGAGGNAPPVQGEVWNTDPTSPSYYDPAHPTLSTIGPVPYIFETQAIPGFSSTGVTALPDTALQAQAKIDSAAYAQLQLILTAFDTPTFQCVPNPALWEGDIVELLRERMGIGGTYIIQKYTIPLDVSSAMQVTCKPRRQITGSVFV